MEQYPHPAAPLHLEWLLKKLFVTVQVCLTNIHPGDFTLSVINCYTQVNEISSHKTMQKQGNLIYPMTFGQQSAWFERLNYLHQNITW